MEKSNPCADEKHPSPVKELPRLNRISGQIEGVKKMIEERRYCPDILTQLRAVRAAIRAVEANILESHMRALTLNAFQAPAPEDKEAAVGEMKELYKRYDE